MKTNINTLALALALALPTSAMATVLITPTNSATTLANNILGAGVTVIGTPAYTGVTNQSGTFTNGNSSGIGFDSGIVLSTGNVTQIPGANGNGPENVGVGDLGDDISTSLGQLGDTQLSTIVGTSTFDAAALQFDFQVGDGSAGGNLFFNFVFASEEYIDFIGSQYNDVFALFVDGVNVALLPSSAPVSINNVNCNTNNAFYKNNVAGNCVKPNLGLDISFDGLTTVLTAQQLNLTAGTHNMKFVVADTADGILDSAVFIQAGSFSNTNPNQNPIPEPATLALLGLGLAGLGMMRRKA